MTRPTTVRLEEIRRFSKDKWDKRKLPVYVQDMHVLDLFAEIDALEKERDEMAEFSLKMQENAVQLQKEVARLHEKYDFQLLVKERDRLREALDRIAQLQGDPTKSSAGWAGDLARRTVAQAKE